MAETLAELFQEAYRRIKEHSGEYSKFTIEIDLDKTPIKESKLTIKMIEGSSTYETGKED